MYLDFIELHFNGSGILIFSKLHKIFFCMNMDFHVHYINTCGVRKEIWETAATVAYENSPASTDGQHRRAGRLPRLRWALVPRATARNALAHDLIARACHLTYTWSGRWWIASFSFLHGKHVNIKFEPRSALRLFWESAQGSRLTHGLL